jgi:acetyltransferase-like isoleucine patch superfamily enzyme
LGEITNNYICEQTVSGENTMKIHSLWVLILLWVSGTASAALNTYSFSGSFDAWGGCTDDPYCGPYTGTITIDDAQSPTASSNGDWWDYTYEEISFILADGTEYSDDGTLGEFYVPQTATHVRVTILAGLYGPGLPYGMGLVWDYGPGELTGTENIGNVLAALTNPTLTTDGIIVFKAIPPSSCYDNGFGTGCFGSLSALVPPAVIDDTATVSPSADIGAGSTVGANSVIKQDVTVGEGSSIGENVAINKDAQLGDNTVIGDGSTINKDVIAGDSLTVGINVTIHKDVMIGANVTIGDNTMIHMGTVIGNNATIGLVGGGVGVFIGKDVTIPSDKTIGDGDVIPNNTTVLP